MTAAVHQFGLRFDSDPLAPLYPVATVLVDGDVLGGGHRHLPFIGFPPSAILGADSPLLPIAKPRRVAFYRCDCGYAECNVLAAVIEQTGDQIEWSALRSFSRWGSDGPLSGENVGSGAQLWLPNYVFAAAQYRDEIRRASADASFETPARLRAREDSRLDWETRRRREQEAAAISQALLAAYTEGALGRFKPSRVRARKGVPEIFDITFDRATDAGPVRVTIETTVPPGSSGDRVHTVVESVVGQSPREWSVVDWDTDDRRT